MGYMDTNRPVHETSEAKWYFGELREEETFIVGEFGKVFKDETERYENGKFIEQPEDKKRAMASKFIIYPEKNLLIFNQRKRARHKQFRRAFEAGYNKHMRLEDGLHISLITDTRNIRRVLDDAVRIFEAEFELVPTNPTSNPVMEELDNHIQNMAANKLNLEAESEESLNLEEPLLKAAQEMSEKGYGKYELGYETEDGEREKIGTEESPATKKKKRPENIRDLLDMAEGLIERGREFMGDNDENAE